MTLASGDICRVAVRMKDENGADLVNVFYIRFSTLTETDDYDEIIPAIAGWVDDVYAQLNGVMSVDVIPYDLKVDKVEWISDEWKVTENIISMPWGDGFAPTQANDIMPEGVAALVTLHTNAGRHSGRKFLGGLTETVLGATGDMAASAVPYIMGWASNFIQEFQVTTGLAQAKVVVPDTNTGVIRSILAYTVSTVFAYQRRRRKGRGS